MHTLCVCDARARVCVFSCGCLCVRRRYVSEVLLVVRKVRMPRPARATREVGLACRERDLERRSEVLFKHVQQRRRLLVE